MGAEKFERFRGRAQERPESWLFNLGFCKRKEFALTEQGQGLLTVSRERCVQIREENEFPSQKHLGISLPIHSLQKLG